MLGIIVSLRPLVITMSKKLACNTGLEKALVLDRIKNKPIGRNLCPLDRRHISLDSDQADTFAFYRADTLSLDASERTLSRASDELIP